MSTDHGSTDPGGLPADASLAAKLAAIAGALSRFPKTEHTSGRGSYAFAGVDAIADYLRPAMAEHGIVMYPQRIEIVESERYVRERVDRDSGAAFQTIEWRTLLRVTWCVTDGREAIPVMSTGEALDTSDKSANKAETAARKNAMKSLFNVSTGDDPDPDAHRPGEHVNEPTGRRQARGPQGGRASTPPPPPAPPGKGQRPAEDVREQFITKLREVHGLADDDWRPTFAKWLATTTGAPAEPVDAWVQRALADGDVNDWPDALDVPMVENVYGMLARKADELLAADAPAAS